MRALNNTDFRSGVRAQTLMWAFGFAAATLIYLIAFLLTREQPMVAHVVAVTRNMISLALTVVIVRAALVRWSPVSTGISFWAIHIGLSLAFTLLWAWLLNLTGGLIGSGSAVRFSVSPVLAGAAITWQLIQGLFVYVAVAALTILEHRPKGSVLLLHSSKRPQQEEFLVKIADELVGLAVSDIVSIRGADDYSEVTARNGTHLVATTLQEFEKLLDGSEFVRVHRSAIVNLSYVTRAEPSGGGRMILRMRDGADVPVSRTGAKVLRERAL